jgi:serine/threonine protein phosphatase PrpC
MPVIAIMSNPLFESAQIVVAQRQLGQDRVAIIHEPDRTILVVADGAGGIGDGAAAADTVLREVQTDCAAMRNPQQWESKLFEIDCRIGAGESTAVVVDLRADSIIGASIGDSQAWLIRDGAITRLTSAQNRKPLLGSGSARPVGFRHGALQGVLIVATDGFFNYVKADALAALVAQADFVELPRRCVELVRLPSGELWDDIGLIVCRVPPPSHARQRYAI